MKNTSAKHNKANQDKTRYARMNLNFFPPALSPERAQKPRSNYTPGATNISDTHIFIAKNHSLLKESGVLEDMADSKGGTGKVQHEPEHFLPKNR